MSDEISTNGENPAERKHVMLYEIYAISQEDCAAVVERYTKNTRKLDHAEDKIRKACDLVELLKAADENCVDDDNLSLRTLDQLDRVESLLKSARKKIDKYSDEQKHRDIENYKQRGASLSTEIRSIQDCPDSLRELIAKELCIPLDKVNGWIDTEDEKGLERIKLVVFDIDRRIKALQNDKGGA